MTNDRRKILEMLAEGKINADDADRLLAKLQSDRPQDPSASEEARPNTGQRPLKYLRVLVNSNDGDNVNIRVPMALVRTGLMLTTMIPAAASDELEKKGVLVRSAKGVSRGLQLAKFDDPPTGGVVLPIKGTIAAGSPIEAIETDETFQFDDMLPPHSDVYVLRVRGDSMIEDAICDGDLVLVERREHARDGETVVIDAAAGGEGVTRTTEGSTEEAAVTNGHVMAEGGEA